MKKRTIWKRIGDFLEGKGFYIVLFLCVAAIGGSGYYLYRMVSLTDQMPSQSVSARAEVPAAGSQNDVEVTMDQGAGNTTAADQNKEKKEAAAKGTTGTKQEESPTAKAEGDQDLEAEASRKTSGQANQSQNESALTTSGSNSWTWPLKGKVVEAFSAKTLTYNEAMGDWRTHTGIDIAANEGEQVTTAAPGTVISVKDDVLLGKTVTIQTTDKLKTVYGNLAEKLSVASGEKVKAGQVIGTVGQTASGEKHDTDWLHFGVEKNGRSVDPMKYLPKQSAQNAQNAQSAQQDQTAQQKQDN